MRSGLSNISVVVLGAGVVLAVAGQNGFSVWAGLELNAMGFLALMVLSYNNQSEAALKYLIIQFLGSFMFLWSTYLPTTFFSLSSGLITVSLAIKLGCAPFHYWLPEVCAGQDWSVLGILLTLQKLAPLSVLESVYSSNIFMLVVSFSIMSLTMGSLMGVFESAVKKILGFSSVAHLGWFLLSVALEEGLWLTYFMLYLVLVLSLICWLSSVKLTNLTQTKKMGSGQVVILFSLLLSLGGMPPFLGFLPKAIVGIHMVKSGFFLVSVYFSCLSVLVIFFYIRMSLYSMSLLSTGACDKPWASYSFNIVFILVFNFFGTLLGWSGLSLML